MVKRTKLALFSVQLFVWQCRVFYARDLVFFFIDKDPQMQVVNL